MSARELIILGCSSQQPTRTRNHGAYLFRWNQEGFLFDPGEGTQRQFIFAGVAPPCVTRIFISHFHGDHCLGLGSMLMRLNLDKVTHPIHCYYPASGKVYFDRLRYSTIYHENIQVIEHPIKHEGLVEDDGKFKIEAFALEHGVDNFGYRITEAEKRKFDKEKLSSAKIFGPNVRLLEEQGEILIEGKKILLDEVSWMQKGAVIAVVSDTRYCANAIKLAQGATLLLCESTYLEQHKQLAKSHLHLTAKEAATIAKKAGVEHLVLTHFSARYNSASDFESEASEIFPHVSVAKDGKIIAF